MGVISFSVAWLAFKQWCKKYWQIIVGFLGGLIAVFALMAKGQNPKHIFEKKNELRDKEAEAHRVAREAEDAALKENLEKFFATNEKAKEDYLDKLADLDEEKRSRVLELLMSENPEEDIAAGLKDFLN